MTLSAVPVGQSVRLSDTSAHPSARRLAVVGLRPGAVVSVLRQTSGGGRLLRVGESRLAVDRATLRALHAEPLATSV